MQFWRKNSLFENRFVGKMLLRTGLSCSLLTEYSLVNIALQNAKQQAAVSQFYIIRKCPCIYNDLIFDSPTQTVDSLIWFEQANIM